MPAASPTAPATATTDASEPRASARDGSGMRATARDVLEMRATARDVLEMRATARDVLEMRATARDVLELRATARSVLRELARERPVPLRVRGSCMAPLVADGSRVEIAPAGFYWPGDVVAIAAPDGRLLLHRLLGYRLRGGRLACVTRGDACDSADPAVGPHQLLGRTLPRPAPAERLRAVAAFVRLAGRRLARRRPARRGATAIRPVRG
jgi:tRNA threonylcarbamoyladenosine modification (KEOPS) complex  Pcc1 subunit